MFWGAGDKSSMTAADEELLDLIFPLLESLATMHKHGSELSIIIADVHIAQNGHGRLSRNDVQLDDAPSTYLREVTQRFAEQDASYNTKGTPISIHVSDLSDIYRVHNLPFLIDSNNISNEDRDVASRYANFLLGNAEKHNKARVAPEKSVLLYVARRRMEQIILRTEFPNAILIATGGRTGARDVILPSGMPGIFSGKEAPAPWFKQ